MKSVRTCSYHKAVIGVDQHFGKWAYLLACQEFDDVIATTLVSVRSIGSSRQQPVSLA